MVCAEEREVDGDVIHLHTTNASETQKESLANLSESVKLCMIIKYSSQNKYSQERVISKVSNKNQWTSEKKFSVLITKQWPAGAEARPYTTGEGQWGGSEGVYQAGGTENMSNFETARITCRITIVVQTLMVCPSAPQCRLLFPSEWVFKNVLYSSLFTFEK